MNLRLYKDVGKDWVVFFVKEPLTGFYSISMYSDKPHLIPSGTTHRHPRWRKATWLELLLCLNVYKKQVEDLIQVQIDRFLEKKRLEEERRQRVSATLIWTSSSVNFNITYHQWTNSNAGVVFYYNCATTTS